MTKRGDEILLSDILHEAEVAVGFCAGMSLDQFKVDDLRLRAIERCLEIIGEAASKTSETTKMRLKEIPWTVMTGMRNLLAHAYWGTDPEILYKTIQNDLPDVIRLLQGAGLKSTPTRQR